MAAAWNWASAIWERLTLGHTILVHNEHLDSEKIEHLIRKLQRYRNFKNLDFTHCAISERNFLEFIEAVPSTGLVKLQFKSVGLNVNEAKVISALVQATRINSLNLDKNPEIGNEGLRYLSYALTDSAVEYLSLSGCGIDQIGMEHLAKALKTGRTMLTRLDLSNNPLRQSVLLLTQVLQHTRITTLELSNVGLGGRSYLGMLLFAKVAAMKTLETLVVGRNTLGDSPLEVMPTLLNNNQALTHLQLSRCEIGNLGVTYIAEGLRLNNHLERLDLSCNFGITDYGICLLQKSILGHRTLKEINLHGCIHVSPAVSQWMERQVKALQSDRAKFLTLFCVVKKRDGTTTLRMIPFELGRRIAVMLG